MKNKTEVNCLENWATLNKYVQFIDEATLQALIKKEAQGQARPQFLMRLYGRFNRLRTTRERRELLATKK